MLTWFFHNMGPLTWADFLTLFGLISFLLSSRFLWGEVSVLHLLHHALSFFNQFPEVFTGHRVAAGAGLLQLVKQRFKHTQNQIPVRRTFMRPKSAALHCKCVNNKRYKWRNKTELNYSSPWIFLRVDRISESRSFALLWVFSTSVTALSASATVLSAYIKIRADEAHSSPFSLLKLHENENILRRCLQPLYLVFKGVDVIWEIDLVLFQLSDFRLLAVDGYVVFVDKSL